MALSGIQWYSVAISGNYAAPKTKKVSGNQWHSVVIRGNYAAPKTKKVSHSIELMSAITTIVATIEDTIASSSGRPHLTKSRSEAVSVCGVKIQPHR